MLPEKSLDLFFPDEIQKLISGGHNEISIDDLMHHSHFNGYNVDEKALNTMSPAAKEKQEDTKYIMEFFDYLKSLPNE